MPHGDTLEANLATAARMLEEARAQGAELALLPEYFFGVPGVPPPGLAPWAGAVHEFLRRVSARLAMTVAGNVVESVGDAFRNVGVVYDAGRLILAQEKVHPMPREAASGVVPGERLEVRAWRDVPVGMLVCADILYPEAARVLALQGARVLLNPVMSPWRAEDATKAAREAVFVARAYDAGAFVLKAGGYRRPSATPEATSAGPPMAIAGRSLITAPWGVLARYHDDLEEAVLVAELDFQRLEQFRRGQEAFPPRQPAAYRDLL